ncbi:unnamed protein product [Blepharisma stoltei]|uniref:CSC1/OSCA1-like cytosolic domain-containing protein n=1 Tax=Blepharisma stoltei TaxID=1481888 RepID=A0AAU9I6R7_9CILI|nr:unnamed protein product [Blepharisma stoltei]
MAAAAVFNSLINAALNIDRSSLQKNADSDSIEKELQEPADLKKAWAFRHRNSITDNENDPKPYGIWKLGSSDFGEYGVGLQLHFLFLKQMMLIFFIIGGISIWPIYENYQGDQITTSDGTEITYGLTIANRVGIASNVTDVSVAESDQDDIDDAYRDTWIADAIYTGLFIIALLLYTIQSKVLISKTSHKTARVSDYAIQVKGLPRDEGVTPQEVKDHFRSFGKIIEVYLGRRYNDLIIFYQGRAILKKKICNREALLRFSNKDLEKDKKLKVLKLSLKRFDEKIKKEQLVKKHNELPIKYAYITFNSKKDKQACIKAYQTKCCCSCLRKKRKDLYFRRKYPLKVFTAQEPSDIIWENLEISKCSRRFRTFLALILTLILLIISVALIYGVKRAQKELPNDSKCDSLKVDADISINEAKKEYTTQDETYCWCQGQSWDDLISKSDYSDYCSSYIETVSWSSAVKFFSCCGIIIVNFFIKTLMILITSCERTRSRSSQQTRVMLKVFVAMTVNTALITYLVNLDSGGVGFSNGYILEGEYSDFSRYWYVKVGSIFIITMFICVGSPHLIYLLIMYPIGACRRKWGWKKYATQYEINDAFLGPEFMISTRTSQILTIMFTCYIYSGGMPLLNCICFAALFIIYWTDKFLLLRHYRMPPKYKADLYIQAMRLMPLCIIIHCAVSLVCYGCPDVFPTSFYTKSSGYVTSTTPSFEKRLKNDSGIANIILAGSSAILLLLIFFIDEVSACVMKSKNRRTDETQDQKTFKEVEMEIQKSGLSTYNLMKNPNYMLIIETMNESAEITKGQLNIRSTPYQSPRGADLQRTAEVSDNNNGEPPEESKSETDRSAMTPVLNSNISERSADDIGSESSSDVDFNKEEQSIVYTDTPVFKSPKKSKKVAVSSDSSSDKESFQKKEEDSSSDSSSDKSDIELNKKPGPKIKVKTPKASSKPPKKSKKVDVDISSSSSQGKSSIVSPEENEISSEVEFKKRKPKIVPKHHRKASFSSSSNLVEESSVSDMEKEKYVPAKKSKKKQQSDREESEQSDKKPQKKLKKSPKNAKAKKVEPPSEESSISKEESKSSDSDKPYETPQSVSDESSPEHVDVSFSGEEKHKKNKKNRRKRSSSDEE